MGMSFHHAREVIKIASEMNPTAPQPQTPAMRPKHACLWVRVGAASFQSLGQVVHPCECAGKITHSNSWAKSRTPTRRHVTLLGCLPGQCSSTSSFEARRTRPRGPQVAPTPQHAKERRSWLCPFVNGAPNIIEKNGV